MALIKCAGCRHQISSRAPVCPKCGYPNEAATRPRPTRKPVAEAQPEEAPQEAYEPTPVSADRGPLGAPAAQAEPAPQTAERAGLPPNRFGALAADAEDEESEPWFYVTPDGRQGPAELAQIRLRASRGEIAQETPIWKPGLADWVPLSQYREEIHAGPEPVAGLEPPPAPRPAVPWLVALAPIWGGVVQIVATEAWVATTHKKLAYYAEMWWIVVLLNLLVCYLDQQKLKKSGPLAPGLEGWNFLLVPLYLYRRKPEAERLPKTAFTWVVSALAAVACFTMLNAMYAKLLIR